MIALTLFDYYRYCRYAWGEVVVIDAIYWFWMIEIFLNMMHKITILLAALIRKNSLIIGLILKLDNYNWMKIGVNWAILLVLSLSSRCIQAYNTSLCTDI